MDNLTNVFRLLDKDFNESLAKYQPNLSQFYDIVRAELGGHWFIARGDIWFMCTTPETVIPLQGWKIHVSSTTSDASTILSITSRYLSERGDTSFKFSLDMPTLTLMNSKTWSRAGSGKFITIYPASETSFKQILSDLHARTNDCKGPFILSDKRYRDSRVLYYRYGGMARNESLSIRGEKIPILVAPDGMTVPDIRTPYYAPPEWSIPPFPDDVNTAGTDDGLIGKDYRVDSVLTYSNSGGVYAGTQISSGRKVLIKEARPHVSSTTLNLDAISVLRKEFEILQSLTGRNLTPEAIDMFEDWEHLFIVEEFVEGTSLADFFIRNSLLLRTRPDSQLTREYLRVFCTIFRRVAEKLERLHARGIVLGDLSSTNIIISPDGVDITFIDFEGAYRLAVDVPTNVFTPGFAADDHVYGNRSTYKSDCYGLGALMWSALMPINSLAILKRSVLSELLDQLIIEYSFPTDLATLILALLSSDTNARPSAMVAGECLRSIMSVIADLSIEVLPQDFQWEDTWTVRLEEISIFINSQATPERSDRLFPADPRLFTTNPLSVSYGAAGVIYSLLKAGMKIDDKHVEWMLRRRPGIADYPPGLYMGLAGISWTLLECGFNSEAVEILDNALKHPLLKDGCDLYYGMSGVGFTCLQFFVVLNDDRYLREAITVADELLARGQMDDSGLHWKNEMGEVHLGLAHGASGIALFMLYVYYATGHPRYLEAGMKALDFDLSYSYLTKDGGLSWPYTTEKADPVLPYWRHGSAGVGSVVIRYSMATSYTKYLDINRQILLDVDRKYTMFPGRFYGLAGLGSYLSDCFYLTNDKSYADASRKVADGLRIFSIERGGIAFPGDGLSRISCDYGTGAAGILGFLSTVQKPRQADFMIDGLIPSGVRSKTGL